MAPCKKSVPAKRTTTMPRNSKAKRNKEDNTIISPARKILGSIDDAPRSLQGFAKPWWSNGMTDGSHRENRVEITNQAKRARPPRRRNKAELRPSSHML